MSRVPQRQIPQGVELLVSTWSKDSHGLYDYETTENKFYNQSFYITDTCRIYRHTPTMRTNIIYQKHQEQSIENIYIGTMVVNNGKFTLQSAATTGIEPHASIKYQYPDLYQNSLIVVKDTPNPDGYMLSAGNIIRLGRVEYTVLEVRNNNEIKTYKQASHMEINNGTHKVDKMLQGSCKVCLCEESPPEDPLIAPCCCKGTCQLIHVDCLKNWIFSKVRKEIHSVASSYNFSKYECEICKMLFPKYVQLQDGKIIDMITIQKPDKPYIILESMSDRNQSSKQERNLHLISLSQGKSLKLGRGHQCQIRITDISVSRTHAQIGLKDGKFYLKDLNSKFGTLIKFREELEINSKTRIQYGRTLFEFNPQIQKQLETQLY